MIKLQLVCLLFAAAAVITPRADAARVTAERIAYSGYAEAYRVSNGSTELVFVPAIGRIMRYGPVGGANILWENADLRGKTGADARGSDWMNFGGDKLWNAPQERWGWPPDTDIDRGACSVKLLPGGALRITGTASAKYGLRFEREIRMSASDGSVTLRNTLRNVGKAPVEWAVWEVAQVDRPDFVALPKSQSGRFPVGYYVFGDTPLPEGAVKREGDRVLFHRHPTVSSKIGTDSAAGWIRARVQGMEFTISAAYAAGRTYCDSGCALQSYVNQDPLSYAEMELLGPVETIAPGHALTLTTQWKYTKQP